MRTLQGQAPDTWPDRDQAKCKDQTELFFAPKADRKATRRALKLCHECPLEAKCKEWALYNEEEGGIWGGMTESERQYYVRTYGKWVF